MSSSCSKIALNKTGSYPELLLDYIDQKAELRSFYNEYPTLENFQKLVQNRKFSPEKRRILVEELEKQYVSLDPGNQNIALLKSEKTFTVTTGHQLNIFTGPLYIIYKIVSTIELANKLKETYPEYNFVPMYWMATEDHDLEEIQKVSIFGKSLLWDTAQKGAVGKMMAKGLNKMAKELGNAAHIWASAYQDDSTLAECVRKYMHELFGHKGLVSIDADTAAFKNLFKEVIEDDLKEHSAYKKATFTTQKLEELGYKTQITPREINLFFLEDSRRERIVKKGQKWFLNESGEELDLSSPEIEKYSPNVVLRPLYQEVILPNLAYFGGPGEVPYWLQLKGVFDHFNVDFPALIPRNFALLLMPEQKRKFEKLGLEITDIFLPIPEVETIWIKGNSKDDLAIEAEKKRINESFEALKLKLEPYERTLGKTAEVFRLKTDVLLHKLELKALRAAKRKYHVNLERIHSLKNSLFPGNGLQERKENIIPFLADFPELLEDLHQNFDPLDFRFNILFLEY